MRSFGFFFMLLFIGTAAFVYLGFSSKGSTILNPGMVSIGNMNAMTLAMKRKLKQQNMDHSNEDADVYLEDYPDIDPIPSSTASIRNAPVQHGTPLMPYVPKPSPPPTPTQAKHAEFP